MGWRILISACDFLMLGEQNAPTFWWHALQVYGALEGLTPRAPQQDRRPETPYAQASRRRTVRVRKGWSLREILMEPTSYNINLGAYGVREWERKIDRVSMLSIT